jgi:RHS repeat-associated protein
VNLRYAGQYYDAETGLHYNWHRYYDPKTGRYITSDPIGLDGGLNTFTYVRNNPLRWTDSTGLVLETWEPQGHPEDIGPADPCFAVCFAKRKVICLPMRAGGMGIGLTVAGIASIPSGGAAFGPLARPAAGIGGFAGNLVCEAIMFPESCSEERGKEKPSCSQP